MPAKNIVHTESFVHHRGTRRKTKPIHDLCAPLVSSVVKNFRGHGPLLHDDPARQCRHAQAGVYLF